MDDNTPTDSDNVVSLDEFRLKHNTNPMEEWGLAPVEYSELLSSDYDKMFENLKGLLEEIRDDDMPTYRDWCSLSAVLAILGDTVDHLFANHAVQYEQTLFKASSDMRDVITSMQDYTKTFTDPLQDEE